MRSHVRYWIVSLLFFASTINYADRGALSVVKGSLKLGPEAMGILFSAWAWSYTIAQIPSGWLLDRYGSKNIYGLSILIWSVLTFMAGLVRYTLSGQAAVVALFVLALLAGFAYAPAFPGNGRIVAAWFPTKERGTASALFTNSIHFSQMLFFPLMAWLTKAYGWPYVFFVMGLIGIGLSVVWFMVVDSPREQPWVSPEELDYIERGGALVNMDLKAGRGGNPIQWEYVWQLLQSRMMIGAYLGQYCITTLTYFFITWFPAYLVDRGMSILKTGLVASFLALFGFMGGMAGGSFSDFLIRRGYSLTVARKTPIVLGMLISCTMIACNYTNKSSLIIAFMAAAYLGKGWGSLGWTVVSDTSPKEIVGLSGGLFNMFGNLSGVISPIVVGYLIKWYGFNAALIFVGANAVGAILSYLLVVGPIQRLQLIPVERKLT